MRAQAEFVVILAVVLVFVIVSYYAFRGFEGASLPEDVKKLQEVVEQEVESVVRDGVLLAVKDMETHGGYLTKDILLGGSPSPLDLVGSVRFAGEDVPYWQVCQNDLSLSEEELENRIGEAVKNYVLNQTKRIDVFGKNVSFEFSSLGVDVNILPDKVVVETTLPTTVNGYKIRRPYHSEVRTKFGEITEFARELSRELSANRNFDWFTIYSMYFSRNLADGQPLLPTEGVLTECGVLFRSPEQISEGLTEAVNYVVGNTEWWKDAPVSNDVPKTFSIKKVNGKSYPDLSVNTFLPDGFGISVTEPVLFENTKFLVKWIFFAFPECVYVYDQFYDVSYPIIVRADDQYTGYSFNMAGFVYVTRKGGEYNGYMAPGECSSPSAGVADSGECGNLECEATIKVNEIADSNGGQRPLEGAAVVYGGCFVGYTGPDGVVSGPVKCGVNNLTVFYDRKHEILRRDGIDSSSLDNSVFGLHVIPNVTFHFKEVSVEPEPSGIMILQAQQTPVYKKCVVSDVIDKYSVVDMRGIDSGRDFSLFSMNSQSQSRACVENSQNCQECRNSNINDINEDECSRCLSDCPAASGDVNVDYIPAGRYSISSSIRDQTSGLEYGGFLPYNYQLNGNAKDVYIYTPVTGYPSYDIGGSKKQWLVNFMKDECGMVPVSDSEQPERVYITECNYQNIGSVIGDAGCAYLNQNIGSVSCYGYVNQEWPNGCDDYCDPSYDDCGTLYDVEGVKSMFAGHCNVRLVCE